MTAWLHILFLAVLQGITEFLPVSSSGHLVLARHLLGIEAPGLVLEMVLHAGSLLSIVLFFRRRLIALGRSFIMGGGEGRSYAAVVILATLPAAVLGLLLKGALERHVERPAPTAALLFITGLILIASRRAPRAVGRALTWRNGLAVGLAQAVAIMPGISRSGVTITMGRHLGLRPEVAAEFSFVLAIPVLTGTTVLMLRDLSSAQAAGWSASMLLAGMLVSTVTGYGALHVLLRLLRGGRFWMFGIYCLLAGGLGLAWFLG